VVTQSAEKVITTPRERAPTTRSGRAKEPAWISLLGAAGRSG
jgi:hypothetical protein